MSAAVFANTYNCFWDIETSGLNSSNGGTGKTTAEMKTKTTFTDAGWDFNTIWDIDGVTNDGYPFFRDGITSVEEDFIMVDEDSYSIFPNPASDAIIINYNKGLQPLVHEITIYNVLGEKVKTLSQSERELRIDVSDFSNGTYFITITTDNKVFTEKFVKMK